MRNIKSGNLFSLLRLGGMVLMFALILPATGILCGEELVLVESGKSPYRIVIPQDAIPSVRFAGEELQKFVAEMTGVTLPVVTDDQPRVDPEIILGSASRLAGMNVAVDVPSLGMEGYILKTVGPNLVIFGGEPRGTLYGVYDLLEEKWGCRWFTPDCSRIPKHERLALPALDEKKVPVLEYREPFTADCFDGDWCARNRMNSSMGRLEARHGGKVRFGNGFFVHTFERLVPPEKYFDEHPEYFSLVKGKRLKERSQLCCTNEDVIRLCTEGILRAIESDPDAFVWSVSQNDWYNYCECDRCQALAEAEGSQIAPVLQLVNRVAEAVAERYPDKAIETLAYQWTRKPPKTLRPRPNVIIRLCSIECCFSHPLETCDLPANRAFVEDLQGWAKVANRLWIWDYVTDFRHYLLPFPNQRVRNDNVRLFIRNNVRGIFEQDTYNTLNSELAALGGYMTAKFLWNPDYDEDTAMNEFLDAYYGAGAPFIRRYIDRLHDYAEKENVHCSIWVPPTHGHLTDELLVESDELWQNAEKAVADQPEILQRVRIGRLSVDYAILERARSAPDKEPLASLAKKRFAPFVETIPVAKITRLMEWQTLNLEEYRNDLAKALGIAP
ncbi:MAG: DUF4838 domain-containing protein [Thermogutta sp.]